MLKKLSILLVICALLLPSLRCIQYGARIKGNLAPHVEQIPGNIAIFPLLSTPLKHRRMPQVHLMKSKGQVYITPPAETDLKITQRSQIMTDMISSELMDFGFVLKQLPVEVTGNDSSSIGADRRIGVSLELIRELREKYNLEAILIGNVFFTRDVNMPGRVLVTAAHLKMVDVETLDMICHVSYPYEERGEEIESISYSLARELALMAGLLVEPSTPAK